MKKTMKMRKARSHKNKRKTQRGGIKILGHDFFTKKWEEFDLIKKLGLKKDDPSNDPVKIPEPQVHSEVQKKETVKPKWRQITKGENFLDYVKDDTRFQKVLDGFQKVLDAKQNLSHKEQLKKSWEKIKNNSTERKEKLDEWEDNIRFQKVLKRKPTQEIRDKFQEVWENIKNNPTKRKEALDKWDPPKDLALKTPTPTYDHDAELSKNKEIIGRLYNIAIDLLNSHEYIFFDKESLKMQLESAKQKSTPDSINSIIIEIKKKLSKKKKIEQQDQDAMEEISKRAKQDFRMMSRLSPESYSVRRSSLGPERTQGGSRKRKQTKQSKRLRYKSRRLRK
jgi:hypothetical protein